MNIINGSFKFKGGVPGTPQKVKSFASRRIFWQNFTEKCPWHFFFTDIWGIFLAWSVARTKIGHPGHATIQEGGVPPPYCSIGLKGILTSPHLPLYGTPASPSPHCAPPHPPVPPMHGGGHWRRQRCCSRRTGSHWRRTEPGRAPVSSAAPPGAGAEAASQGRVAETQEVAPQLATASIATSSGGGGWPCPSPSR